MATQMWTIVLGSSVFCAALAVGNTLNNDKNTAGESFNDTAILTGEIYSKDVVAEGRPTRCLLGARRHLRKGDADQVASYFLNGGPSSGRSHFVGAANPTCESPASQSSSNDFNSGSGDPRTSPVSTENLYTRASDAYETVGRPLHYPLYNAASKYQIAPNSRILNSLLHPHPYTYPYHQPGILHSLSRVATIPAYGLARAQTALNHLVTPNLYHTYPAYNSYLRNSLPQPQGVRVGSPAAGAKSADEQASPRSNTETAAQGAIPQSGVPGTYSYYQSPVASLYNPQSGRYVLQWIPYTSQTQTSNPTVGSTQDQSSPTNNIVGAQTPTTESPSNIPVTDDKSNDCSDGNEKQSNQEQEENEREMAKREYKAENQSIVPGKKVSKKSIKQTKSEPFPLKKSKDSKSYINIIENLKAK